MTDRLFIYAVDQGGGIYKLQIQQVGDEVSAMIADSVMGGNDRVLITDPSGVLKSINVGQNEILAKVGTQELNGETVNAIRTLINVDDDADKNLAANKGTGAGVFKDIDSPDPAFINLRSLIAASDRRTKLTQGTDDITIDAVVTPKSFDLVGNATIAVGSLWPLFKTEQAMTIDALSAIIIRPSAPTTNEDLGYNIISNPTMVTAGATIHVGMEGANVLTDFDDTVSGAGRSSYDQADTDTRILVPAIPANSWVMLDIKSKTDPLEGFHISLFLQNT